MRYKLDGSKLLRVFLTLDRNTEYKLETFGVCTLRRPARPSPSSTATKQQQRVGKYTLSYIASGAGG